MAALRAVAPTRDRAAPLSAKRCRRAVSRAAASGTSAASAAKLWEDDSDLAKVDPELAAIISLEHQRQRKGLELIASENFTSKAVMQAVGRCAGGRARAWKGLPVKQDLFFGTCAPSFFRAGAPAVAGAAPTRHAAAVRPPSQHPEHTTNPFTCHM